MKYIVKPFQILYALYAFTMFIVLLLLLFPFFFLSSFLGKIKGGNMMFRLCTLWADLWFFFVGFYAKTIHEAKTTERRPCVFVANHISYLDIPMIVKIIREPVRPLGKAEMAKVPIFGFLYRNAAVMVDRSSAKNRSKSVLLLKRFLKYGVSIFIFPEGTFNETGKPLKEFYDGAFRIAIETQTPIQPILFLDTVDRMHFRSIFAMTPGRTRAVYIESIDVTGLTHQDLPHLKNLVHAKMQAGLAKYRGA